MNKQVKLDKVGLIDYFFRIDGDEVRSVNALSENLDAVLKHNLDPKELALVMFHALKHAKRGVYGEDVPASLRVIENQIHRWANKATKIKGGYSDYTVSHMLDTCRGLDVVPPETLAKFLSAKAIELMPGFSATAMTYTLHAFAHLAMEPDRKLLLAMQKRLPAIQGDFSTEQACTVMWSMAVIDSVLEHHQGSKRVSMAGVFTSMLKDPKVRGKIAIAQTDSQRNMLSDSTRWFIREPITQRAGGEEHSSIFENDVADKLKSAGATISPVKAIRPLKHRIDVAGHFNKTSFMIECDGPTHFVHSADDHKVFLNGNTIFQTALILREEPDSFLLRLPVDTFYQNMNDPDMWALLLEQIDEKGKGGYVLGSNGFLIPLGAGHDAALKFNS